MGAEMITYRSNPTKTRHAVHIGMARVGYIEDRTKGGTIWFLTLLRPTGTGYMGEAADLDAAKAGVERAIGEWMASAGVAFLVGEEDVRLCKVCGGADQHKPGCEAA
jgi:hypothetical protein